MKIRLFRITWLLAGLHINCIKVLPSIQITYGDGLNDKDIAIEFVWLRYGFGILFIKR